MSTTPNDGGPAFPDDRSQVGMSLRDWFAGQALMGIMADHEFSGTCEEIGSEAYRYADAMLAARNPRPNP